jgi:hypothetical protein
MSLGWAVVRWQWYLCDGYSDGVRKWWSKGAINRKETKLLTITMMMMMTEAPWLELTGLTQRRGA